MREAVVGSTASEVAETDEPQKGALPMRRH
jgi:hypothetical protein